MLRPRGRFLRETSAVAHVQRTRETESVCIVVVVVVWSLVLFECGLRSYSAAGKPFHEYVYRVLFSARSFIRLFHAL